MAAQVVIGIAKYLAKKAAKKAAEKKAKKEAQKKIAEKALKKRERKRLKKEGKPYMDDKEYFKSQDAILKRGRERNKPDIVNPKKEKQHESMRKWLLDAIKNNWDK